MVLSLFLHVSRVYMTGGFQIPREIIWLSGSLLSFIVIFFGVTGYTLPWDSIGFWACKIVTSLPDAINDIIFNVGFNLILLIRGSFSVSQATLTRFYLFHTFLFPVLTFILLIVYFLLIRKQGISGPL